MLICSGLLGCCDSQQTQILLYLAIGNGKEAFNVILDPQKHPELTQSPILLSRLPHISESFIMIRS